MSMQFEELIFILAASVVAKNKVNAALVVFHSESTIKEVYGVKYTLCVQ